MAKGRDLMALGGIVAAVGAVALLAEHNNQAECGSFIGQLGQAIDTGVQRDCTAVKVVWDGGILAAGGGAVVFVIGAVQANSAPPPPPPRPPSPPPWPPPGWYPDPQQDNSERWWDGYRWGGQVRPRKRA